MRAALVASSVLLALAACDRAKTRIDSHYAGGGDEPVAVPAAEAGKGGGTVRTDPRTVEAFERIDASGVLELVVKVGAPNAVTVTTDENLLASVKTETRSKTLYVKTEGDLRPSDSVRVEITVSALEDLRLDGVVAASVEGRTQDATDFGASVAGASTLKLVGLRAKSLDVALAGTSRLDAKDLRAAKFHLAMDGAGSAVVTGGVDELRLDVDGSGKSDLSKLAAKDARVALSGTAAAEVDVSRSLGVRASGATTLVYSGNPAELTKTAPAPAVVKSK